MFKFDGKTALIELGCSLGILLSLALASIYLLLGYFLAYSIIGLYWYLGKFTTTPRWMRIIGVVTLTFGITFFLWLSVFATKGL